MTVLYVDVSHHDVSRRGGQPDWARIREATSPVMCARATYGDPQGYNPPSRYFRDLIGGARKAGFTLLGAYHNLVRGDQASINRQVDYLRREMDAAGATWAMLDVERYEELVAKGLHPRFEDAVRFCERWRAVDKRVLAVYLPKWIWDGHMGRPDLRKLAAPLVASNYGSNPDGNPGGAYRARGGDAGVGWNAYGGVTPAIWQYGSDVDCPGASGQTDLNAFRGSLTELRALLTGQSQEEDMPLTEADQPVIRAAVHSTEIGRSGVTFAQALDSLRSLPTAVAALRVELAQLAGRDLVNESEIVAGVLAGLGARPADDVVAALAAAGVNLADLRAALDRAASPQAR